jgi:hypothetical protein
MRAAASLENRSKMDTRFADGQAMDEREDRPCGYIDAGQRLTSIGALEHSVPKGRVIL